MSEVGYGINYGNMDLGSFNLALGSAPSLFSYSGVGTPSDFSATVGEVTVTASGTSTTLTWVNIAANYLMGYGALVYLAGTTGTFVVAGSTDAAAAISAAGIMGAVGAVVTAAVSIVRELGFV
jgi:hypothetical protein